MQVGTTQWLVQQGWRYWYRVHSREWLKNTGISFLVAQSAFLLIYILSGSGLKNAIVEFTQTPQVVTNLIGPIYLWLLLVILGHVLNITRLRIDRNRELEPIITSPLSRRVILGSYLLVTIINFHLGMIEFVTISLWTAVLAHSWWPFLGALIAMPPLTILANCIGLWIGLGGFAIQRVSRNHKWISIGLNALIILAISGLLLIIFHLVWHFQVTIDYYNIVIHQISSSETLLSRLALWPVYSFLLKPTATICSYTITIGVLLLTAKVLSHLFYELLQEPDVKQKSVGQPYKLTAFKSGKFQSIILREWRMLLRKPILIFIAFMLFIIYLYCSLIKFYFDPIPGLSAGTINVLLCGGGGFITSGLMTFVVNSEEAVDWSTTLPVSSLVWQRSMFLSVMIPCWILSIIFSASAYLFDVNGMVLFGVLSLTVTSQGLQNFWNSIPGLAEKNLQLFMTSYIYRDRTLTYLQLATLILYTTWAGLLESDYQIYGYLAGLVGCGLFAIAYYRHRQLDSLTD